MDITIHQTFLPHHDPEASLAFYRDTEHRLTQVTTEQFRRSRRRGGSLA